MTTSPPKLEEMAKAYLEAFEAHLLEVTASTPPATKGLKHLIEGTDPAQWMQHWQTILQQNTQPAGQESNDDPQTPDKDRSETPGLSPEQSFRRMAELEARLATLEERIHVLERASRDPGSEYSPED